MRKTSHDGVDSTSISSGFENETKKPGPSNIKSKKSSIKRKVTNFNHEPDDGIIEPLLQSDKETSEYANRSAKYSLSKVKTDFISEVDDTNIVSESVAMLSASNSISTENKDIPINNIKDIILTSKIPETTSIHNQTYSNVFKTDGIEEVIITKNPVLIEFDRSKSNNINSGPLIFTTAKIHNDGKTQPFQVTPMPILSTIENKVVQTGIDNSKTIGNKDVVMRTDEVLHKTFIQKTIGDDFQTNNRKKIPSLIDKDNISTEITGYKDHLNLSDCEYDTSKVSNVVINATGVYESNKGDNNIIINTKVSPSTSNKQKMSKESEYNMKMENILSTRNNYDKQSGSFKSIDKEVAKPVTELSKQVEEDRSKQVISGKTVSQGAISFDTNDKIGSIVKNIALGSKKLQRQNKATLEEAKDSDFNSTKDVKCSSNTLQKVTNISAIPPAALITTIAPPQLSQSPQFADKNRIAFTETGIKNAMIEVVHQPCSSNKTVTTSFSSNYPGIASVKTFPKSGFIKDPILTSEPVKSNIVSPQSSQSVKSSANEMSPTVNETLPPYIVATSKTKIGTSVTTSKNIVSCSNNSKPEVTNTVNTVTSLTTTSNEPVNSASNSVVKTITGIPAQTQPLCTNIQTKSKSDTHKKDSRA